MMTKLEATFGKMNITYGEKQEYLGMDLNIKNGIVKILMKPYLEEAIKAYGEPINSAAKTPATRTLFDINPESSQLSKSQAETFHHIVAKLLHVTKRVRLDIQPTVAFLCRRVKSPTKEDMRKLK